jgi:class 3 adenylate cyclase
MAAVLAADVVGYSRLMGKNGSEACDPQTVSFDHRSPV